MKKINPAFAFQVSENTIYAYAASFFIIAYIGLGFVLPYIAGEFASGIQDFLFGFSQLRFFAASRFSLTAMLVLIGAIVLADSMGIFVRLSRMTNISTIAIAARILFSLVSIALFFLFRTNFINPDGIAFEAKFLHDVPLLGAHVTHDEMWELYLHSRFWFYTNTYFNWNVALSYQIFSAMAGGVFVFLLLTYISAFFQPTLPTLLAFLACISGGYIQLFFGDVENYTLTTVWILGYFFVSALFIEKKVSVVFPSALLAVALTFHLLSGFLIPSLIFLYLISWKRAEKASIIYGSLVFIGIVSFTLLFFDLNGLPIRNLWYQSHAFGHGGHILSMLVKPSFGYYWDIANLSFLLIPAWVLLIPLLVFNRILEDTINLHLFISVLCMSVFVLFWRAQLGVINDWNLFAPAALPVSLLVWRALFKIKSLSQNWVKVLIWTLFFHSYAWVFANYIN